MLRAARLASCAVVAFAAGVVAPASAQDFPSRPIRLIVPSGPGGGTDILGRNAAQKMGEQLKVPVVVENRAGAGSLTGTDFVAKSAPDGYTLLVGGISNVAMNPALFSKLPYDPIKDFVAVGFISAYPFLLLARPDLPVRDLAELVVWAKERPGKLNFASAGVGTLQHVWGAVLFGSLGVDAIHVPYKSAAPAHQDLMASRVDVMFDNMSASKQYVDAGRLRGLAVSSPARSPQLPAVPTVTETGVGRFEGESWFGLFAPAATPPATVAALRTIVANVTKAEDFATRITRDGGRIMDVPPDRQQALMLAEIERWGTLIRRYKVTAE
jgi:tripartite-type tricarboxylate transporter receptor subunit TctC